MAAKPKLAVFKFASCDGCQLSLLDCEDELLAVAGAVEIANFPEASRAVVKGPYDISLVEGSITTPQDAERIHASPQPVPLPGHHRRLRHRGGHPGAAQLPGRLRVLSLVYATPEYIDTLPTSTPIAEHVRVDFELRGCPINKGQLMEVLGAFLHGRRPHTPTYSVCARVQAPRHGVRDGGPGHALPRARHPGGVRRPVPCLRPRLLRLLRSHGVPQLPRLSASGWHELGGRTSGARPCVPLLQRLGARPSGKRANAMSRKEGRQTITVEGPRPRGGGGRPLRQVPGRSARRRQAADLRAAALLRGLPAGPSLQRSARHHRAHLRDLPGGLPDERRARDGRGVGVTVAGPLRALRRLLYCGEWIESHACTSTCCTPPTSSATRARIHLAADHPEAVQRGLRLKKIGNAIVSLVGRAGDPPRERAGGRLLPAPPAARSSGRWSTS